MFKVIWSNRSLQDLKDIKIFISKSSPKYANITLNSIINLTKYIESNPYFGRIVPEINDKVIREIIKGNYRIIYTFDQTSINIITVHHSARDLKRRNLL